MLSGIEAAVQAFVNASPMITGNLFSLPYCSSSGDQYGRTVFAIKLAEPKYKRHHCFATHALKSLRSFALHDGRVPLAAKVGVGLIS